MSSLSPGGTHSYVQSAPMLEQMPENMGRLPKMWSADAGFCSQRNLELAQSYSAEHGGLVPDFDPELDIMRTIAEYEAEH